VSPIEVSPHESTTFCAAYLTINIV